ncbi:MAG: hypothetical protein QF877_18030, partial [Gammaproteobacteria bacterium]|nr:hypothetical protein [Gammaproteobacteria bacterium]
MPIRSTKQTGMFLINMAEQKPESLKKRSRRRDGMSVRQAKHAARSNPPEIDPCPAGQTGGQYKPLTDPQIRQIYDTAIRILEELGMGESPAILTDRSLACGAYINDLGRLSFSRAMVEDILAG